MLPTIDPVLKNGADDDLRTLPVIGWSTVNVRDAEMTPEAFVSPSRTTPVLTIVPVAGVVGGEALDLAVTG